MFEIVKKILLFSSISLIYFLIPTLVLAQSSPSDPDFSDKNTKPLSTQGSETKAQDCVRDSASDDSENSETCAKKAQNGEGPSESDNVATTISCENLATVVRKGDQSAVLITWKSTEFGGSYTPQERCRIVSQRFSTALQANGGTLKGLNLTNGPVNGRIVICALRTGEEECSKENLLFTLKKENERNAGATLSRLLNIAATGSGSAIEENSNQQIKVDLGSWASRNLRRANTNNVRSTGPSVPNYRRPAHTGF